MSYRSYVALAMPKGDWQELKFEGRKLLGKLFKNSRCQAGWNKNVLFGFS